MSSTSYRDRVYQKYATFQAPRWRRANANADESWRRAVLKRLQKWNPSDQNAAILDLGCGAGHLLSALRSAGYTNLLGIDRSPESVALALRKGLNVLQADVAEFCKTELRTFDVIYAFDIVEHFHKDELLGLLDAACQRLNPGGKLIIQTPNAVSPWASSYRYGDLTHELIFDPECLRSVLSMSGFRAIEIREVAPFLHGLKSGIRLLIWKALRLGCAVWHLAESGTTCGGIYTRNMIACAIKDGAPVW
jgi:2-polyprenyl-3-methyl-5-hydroxy-6-metoxy-1,4-benzoquinol methylase